MTVLAVWAAPAGGGDAKLVAEMKVEEPPEVIAGQIEPQAEPQAGMGIYFIPLGAGSSVLVVHPDGVKLDKLHGQPVRD